MQKKKFYIDYFADTTLPKSKDHTGFKKFSIEKKRKYFKITPNGVEKGMSFLNECTKPITKKKSLLFLKSKNEGIKEMNKIKRINSINEVLTEVKGSSIKLSQLKDLVVGKEKSMK